MLPPHPWSCLLVPLSVVGKESLMDWGVDPSSVSSLDFWWACPKDFSLDCAMENQLVSLSAPL